MTAFDPRRPIVIGNWKQNTGQIHAVELARRIAAEPIPGVQRAICPPAIWLTAVRSALAGSDLQLGAQSLSSYPDGAYTGEISATMIAEVCSFTLVGHSERRRLFDESDSVVNAKLNAALAAGLGVVLCVGETAAQRDAGQAEQVVGDQIEHGLADADTAGHDIVVAYEPVWAIGTGRSATAADARAMTAFIADLAAERLGADTLPVLYGGSVTSANADELFAGERVAGFLVGGASLRAQEFIDICRAVAPSD